MKISEVSSNQLIKMLKETISSGGENSQGARILHSEIIARCNGKVLGIPIPSANKLREELALAIRRIDLLKQLVKVAERAEKEQIPTDGHIEAS